MIPLDIAVLRRRLAVTPVTLSHLVAELPDEAFVFREAPGCWTLTEILCHLNEGEREIWIPRVRVILSDAPERRFTPFDREAGAKRYAGWTVPVLLDEFARLRRESLDALDALGIRPEQLSRTAQHPQLGIVTLEQLLSTWLTHDHGHLAQIARVLTRWSGQRVGPWREFFSLLRSDTAEAR